MSWWVVVVHFFRIIVAPVTRTIRGLTTEVVLDGQDGMPTTCALSSNHETWAMHQEPVLHVSKEHSRRVDALLHQCFVDLVSCIVREVPFLPEGLKHDEAGTF